MGVGKILLLPFLLLSLSAIFPKVGGRTGGDGPFTRESIRCRKKQYANSSKTDAAATEKWKRG